jgi:hypothetical protein
MQAEFRQLDLDFAVALAEVLLDQFEDQQAGGFFFTSHDHEQLIHRPKPGHDNATPSGNGVATTALQRLGHLLGEQRYLQVAERSLALFYPAVSRHASSFCSLLMALEETLTPPQIIVLRGQEPAMKGWRASLLRSLPHALVFTLPSDLVGLPPTMNKPLPRDGAVNAWVCQGVKCLSEITDLQELLRVCKLE